MRREVYMELLQLLDLPVSCCPNIKMITQRFPDVSIETIISIFSQENQTKVIRTNHIHRSRVESYCARYLAGEDLLSISASVDFPPCMILRRMLESCFSLSKHSVGDILKNPQQLEAAIKGQDPPPLALIERLQIDIVRSMLADCSYSSFSDVAKQAAGLEFEFLLCQRMRQLGVPFWTEADLRAQGYYKTPDVRLQVPIAVRRPNQASLCGTPPSTSQASSSWHVVTWIDSKATFGDDRTHSKQLEEQYSTYVNRYGPGLVIYWFGFIDDLAASSYHDGVMVLEDMPGMCDVAMLAGHTLI